MTDLTDWRVKVLEAALAGDPYRIWDIVSNVAPALREELAEAARLILVECEKEELEEKARKADDIAHEERMAAKKATEDLFRKTVVPKQIPPPTVCEVCGSNEHVLCNRSKPKSQDPPFF